MSDPQRTVLVTGGAGYIGSHACKALSQAGYLPVTYDSLIHGHARAVKWGPLERGDILDRARLEKVLGYYKPIAIMHFAAFAYVGESLSDPGKYYRNNVMGSLALIQAAQQQKIDKIVFSSTCATYGTPNELPIRENTPQSPINPYGSSKLMVERMLQDFGVAHGLRAITLRYFNAAGADPEGEIGEAHEPETHLIPLLLDAASGRRPYVTIFGSDYETPDGTCIRDYVHVTDLADAHVKALEALEAGAPSGAFNLGNEQGFSVLEVVEVVKRVTGLHVPVTRADRRAGDPAALVSDSAKAREALGWQPRLAGLHDIVLTAWAWHQKVPRIASSEPETAGV